MSNYTRKTDIKCDCPMERAIQSISGKWKSAIICELLRGDVRLRDLEKLNPEASKRAITQQLREMLEDGLIQKEEFDEYPKKVIYSLTELGKQLQSVRDVLTKFGEKLNSHE